MRPMFFILALLGLIVPSVSAQVGTTYKIYTAQEGELPTEVAKRFNVSIQDILQANPGMVADQTLKQGEVVLVPVREQVAKKPESRKVQQTRKNSQNRSVASSDENISFARAYWVYTVQAGDTLDSIAKRFDVSTTAIAYANNLSAKSSLVPGQVLVIPVFEQRVEKKHDRQTETVTGAQSAPSKAQVVSMSGVPVLPAPRIFGYVGTVISPMAFIRSSSNKKAPIWSRVLRGTQLIITSEKLGWYGVLMINGATGWVRQSEVRKENRTILWDDIIRAFGSQSERDKNLVVAEAMRYLGVPYKYGGTSPIKGLDCSAFVQKVFATRGIRLPRTAAEQAEVGIPVPSSDLRPGDRLYFAVKGNRIDHCGIYIGNGMFIHASGRHNAVVISSLSEPIYARSLLAIRR